MKLHFLKTIASIATLSSVALAGNWPQFWGPNGDGISSEKNLPVTWSETKNLAWKTVLPGSGSSSPITFNNRVFVTCYSGYGVDGQEEINHLKRHLLCIDATNGKILWDETVEATQPEDPYRGYITEHGYASNTPVTDGKTVYAFFGKTGAVAFDFKTGKQLWKKNLGQESSNRRWGSAASPIIYNDLLIVNASDESQSIRALNRTTGEEVWKSEAASYELAYGTPRIIRTNQGAQLIISVPQEIWGLDPNNKGKLVWYANTGLPGNICPTVAYHDGTLFTFGGYPSTGTVALKTGGTGDISSDVLWKSRSTSYVPSVIAHDNHLFWVNDAGNAFCLEAKTGEVIYEEKLQGLEGGGRSKAFYASVVLADEKLYAVSRKAGVFVIDAKPRFKQLSHNKFESDDTDFNATPAISDGKLFLRSNRYLYCIK